MENNKIRNACFNFAIFGSAQYIILTTIAMFLYPGGTKMNHGAEQYIFTQNFLSDLGRTVTYDGAANSVAALLYPITLCISGLSLLLFFNSIIFLFPKRFKIPFSRILISIIGTISGLGYIGIALVPSNINYSLHLELVLLAFSTSLLASIIMAINIYTTPFFKNTFGHTLSGVIILLFFYILLMIFGPKPWESLNGLMIQATGQKIMVYTMLLSLGFVAWGARNISRNPILKEN